MEILASGYLWLSITDNAEELIYRFWYFQLPTSLACGLRAKHFHRNRFQSTNVLYPNESQLKLPILVQDTELIDRLPQNVTSAVTNSRTPVPGSSVSTSPYTPSSTSPSNHIPKTTTVLSNVANDKIITRTRLQDLVKEMDPCEQLDEEVEDLLLQMADEFVTTTVNNACIFAKHRNGNSVEVEDVQLYLEKMYNIWIPGFGTEGAKCYRSPTVTEAHKQRMALIKKSLKKY